VISLSHIKLGRYLMGLILA